MENPAAVLETIESLKPRAVIAGYKRRGNDQKATRDPPKVMAAIF